MLSNPQKSLIKRAQRQAVLDDADYRALLREFAGVESSTDAKLGNSQFDIIMAHIEATYWFRVDSGALKHVFRSNAPFLQRGYWASKNPPGQTSRDRYAAADLAAEIEAAESNLAASGANASYLAGIRRRVGGSDRKYLAALRRTIDSRSAKAGGECPF